MKFKKISHKSRLNLIKLAVVVAGFLMMLTPVASTNPQVDMYSMVTSLGIDSSEFGVKCTAEVILPEEEKGAMGVSIVIDGEGHTLSSALENLSISIGRHLDLSHCAVMVIGKEKAKEGVLDELEYLLSSGKVSPEVSLILSENKDASEFISMLNEYSQKLDADNLLKYTNFGSHNYSQSLITFLKNTYSKSQSAVMPCIEMGFKPDNMNAVEAEDEPENSDKKLEEKQSSDGGEESGGGGGGSGGGSKSGGGGGGGGEESGNTPPTIIRSTDKIGAFTNGKLKAVWGALEANGLAWSDEQTKHGHLILENVTYKGETLDKMSIYLVKKKAEIKSKYKNGAPVLEVNVNAQFSIEERYKVYRLADNAERKDIYNVIEKEIKAEITKSLISVLQKSVEDDVDAFMARDLFYRYHKKQFDRLTKKGEDILDLCHLEIKFDLKIN